MLPFAVRLAWREGRASFRRIGVYMASITLGVGALVAVHSFRADVTRSIREESRTLLGADLRLSASVALGDSIHAIVDSVLAAGGRSSEVTNLVSMVYAPRTESTRLMQVRSVEGAFPLFGRVETTPTGAWERLGEPGVAVVDEAVPIQLDVGIGDTLQIGRTSFVIAGTVRGLPTDVGFQTAVGPRVYIGAVDLPSTGLLVFGSLARYNLYLRLPDGEDPEDLEGRYSRFFRNQSVTSVTAEDQARNLTEGTRILSQFLGLVGLTALLLGGIGVASAIHVYVKEKVPTVAVLRCIGASQASVFRAYLFQAGVLGLLGSAAGVALGLSVQRLLPLLITDVLPVTVDSRLDPWAVWAGLGVGVWVAVMFALIPLLRVRDIAPLQALRADFEPERTGGSAVARALAYGALGGSLVLLSLWQAPEPGQGLVFAAGLSGALALLWVTALALIRLTRRYFPGGASYPLRQGVANLFRPQNQTVAVTLALGFGSFIIAAMFLVESNVQSQLSFDAGADRPNVLLFDVQADQADEVVDLLARAASGAVEVTPVVPARIAAINGRPAEELLSDTTDSGPERWAVRRLYRNTYRPNLPDSEELVAGSWWDEEVPRPATSTSPGEQAHRISLEIDLAEDLGVGVGDRITWDIQGVPIGTTITSLRRVDWARFATNFFVVAEPGTLEDAPQTYLALARVADREGRARMQRDLVRAFPNVSVLDLALVQEALDSILSKVSAGIRFLAVFAVLGGIIVLMGVLSASRFQRMRESALLKTLGAQRSQVLRVLLAEYMALGSLAGLAGSLLGIAAAWGLVTFVFEGDFSPSPLRLLGLWLIVVILTLTVGLANSRGVLRKMPLAVLREVAE